LHRAIDQLRADHPEGGAATASHACYAVTAFLLKHTADGFNYQLMLDVIEASDAESARATYGLRAKDAWPEHALRDVLALGIAAPGAPGPEGGALSVVDEIAQERRRQIEAEGFNAEHDAQHGPGELALAGACYALWDFPVLEVNRIAKELWPWADRWWKPKSVRHDLIRAAALIVAEIERLDRGAAPTEPRPEAVDEALTSLARETDALGLYDDSTKPTLAAQAEAVERAAADWELLVPELSAAAATLRAMPGVVERAGGVLEQIRDAQTIGEAHGMARAALRALGGE